MILVSKRQKFAFDTLIEELRHERASFVIESGAVLKALRDEGDRLRQVAKVAEDALRAVAKEAAVMRKLQEIEVQAAEDRKETKEDRMF